MDNTSKPSIEMLKAVVDPWIQALTDPAKAQEIVLKRLLKGYSQTEYGRDHHAENVDSYKEFKKAFPVKNYTEVKPMIDQVKEGHIHVLLHEEPLYWGCTKGTTGKSKFFPLTSAYRDQCAIGIKRLFYKYASFKNDVDWLGGYRLNLSSTALLGTLNMGGKEMPYGYSMAVGMDLVNKYAGLPQMTPTQEEINSIQGESTANVWEARYQLIYEKTRDQNITHILTSYSIYLGFANYIYRKYKVYPKDLWNVKFMVGTGQPGSNTRFAPPIKTLYGKSVDIRDSYGGSEGYYGAQMDDKKAWAPFYDFNFYEVQTIQGIKQLHEMIPGEIGSLIVSTDYLPRYHLDDLVLAFEPPYFRCIGRENAKLHPYYFGELTGKSDFTYSKPNTLDSWR